MEITTNDNVGGSSSGVGAGGSCSRWNPTKEQLNMLEGLYGQGIRTPSAELIQSITKKLRVYGHIEGKNVFYWFQNHKARQRQKQKMYQTASANNNIAINSLNNNVNAASSADYFNRFYYPSPQVSLSVATPGGVSHPLFQATHSVACSPYDIAQPEFGFYPHHLFNNGQTSSHVVQDFRSENIMAYASQTAANVETNNSAYPSNAFGDGNGQVTLDLFPLHPTVMLRDMERRSTSGGSSTDNSIEASSDQDRSSAVYTSNSLSMFGFEVSPKMD